MSNLDKLEIITLGGLLAGAVTILWWGWYRARRKHCWFTWFVQDDPSIKAWKLFT